MSNHPRVLNRVKEELENYGFGAAGAALLTGRCSLHSELETKLASYTGFEAALLYSSGYLANLGALGALVKKQDWVFHDRLNHASLIDAILMGKSRHRRYPHLGLPLISAPDKAKSFLVTESIFSMDGDKICTSSLLNYCTDHRATLYIDDAHGFGITGGGRGIAFDLANHKGSLPEMLLMITLGKALGSTGGVVLASKKDIDYLVQYSRPFIYDTAPPPVAAAAALEALSVLQESDGALINLLEKNIRLFREKAEAAGLPLMDSTCAIRPIIVGDATVALRLEEHLKKFGIYVRAIRPPTVPEGRSRLRITLSSQHSEDQIKLLVDVLESAFPNGE